MYSKTIRELIGVDAVSAQFIVYIIVFYIVYIRDPIGRVVGHSCLDYPIGVDKI